MTMIDRRYEELGDEIGRLIRRNDELRDDHRALYESFEMLKSQLDDANAKIKELEEALVEAYLTNIK